MDIAENAQVPHVRRPARHLRIVVAACVSITSCLAATALAQYDPGATLDLGMGYGQNALSQSAMRNASDNLRESKPRDDADYAGSGMSRTARLEGLRREYARRVATDGAASADAWAVEMGRRDARAERD